MHNAEATRPVHNEDHARALLLAIRTLMFIEGRFALGPAEEEKIKQLKKGLVDLSRSMISSTAMI
jgi:hypothetical protein